MKLTRRQILQTSVAAGFPSLMWGTSYGPHMNFPANARERLSVTTWPFRGYMEAPHNSDRDRSLQGMDIKSFADEVVSRFNVRNINPLLAHFPSQESSDISSLREYLATRKIRMVDLGLSGKQFSHPDAARRAAAVEYGKHGIDIAAQLGCPSVRQHLDASGGNKPDLNLTASSLSTLADAGAAKNVAVLLENDDPLSEDPFFLTAVIDKVGNPYLRALPDFGNSLGPSGDAERNAAALRELFARSWNMCHVKAAFADDNGKLFQVDVPRIFHIASERRYKGFYSMESDKPGDPFKNTAELIDLTLKNVR